MLQLNFPDRVASRGETEINVAFEDVVAFLKDNTSIEKIDEMLESQEVLLEKEGYEIQYLKYKGIFPVSGRDFVILTADKRVSDERHVFATVSTNYNRPEVKGAVRATVKCAGYEVTKIGDKKTKVIYISDADPAGSLPGFIKTMVSKNQASVPVNLKRYLEGKKK